MLNELIDLELLTLYDQEIKKLIKQNEYVLPKASSDTLGAVKIGNNVDVDTDGVISVKDASITQSGVVQLNDTVASTLTTQAATANAVKQAYDKANAALPKAGGTLTGALTLAADPSANMQAATKQYVDTEISLKLKASDAMTFKGTLGTSGTVTTLPLSDIVRGDTYKVITAGSYAGYTCKIGDLLIAMEDGSIEATTKNWVLIPSGDERETTIRVATSGVNIDTTAKTGDVILGMASQKQVDTSIAVGTSSVNLPTVKAVADYVASVAYQKTIKYLADTITLGAGDAATISQGNGTTQQRIRILDNTTTGDAVFSFDQSVDSGAEWTALLEVRDDGNVVAKKFTGALVGNADSATVATTATKTAKTLTFSGGVVGTFNGSTDLTVPIPTTLPASGGNADTAARLKTPHNITIGSQTKAFDGSADITFDLTSIGAAAANHNHDNTYLKLTGGVLTGNLTMDSSSNKENPPGIKWWNSSYMTWINYMIQSGVGKSPTGATAPAYGNVTSYSLHSIIESTSGYGWIWESCENKASAVPDPKMALSSNNGNLYVKGSVAAPTFIGSLTGNASTASSAAKLTTARNIKIGNQTKAFDGAGDITFDFGGMGVAAASHNHYRLIESKLENTDFQKHIDTLANIHQTGASEELNLFRFFVNDSKLTPSGLNLPVIDSHNLVFSIDNQISYTRVLSLDIRTNDIYTIAKANGSWGPWVKLLNSSNYTSYTVTKDGGGATGNWAINITGSAGSVAKLTTKRNLTTNLASTTAGQFDGSGDVSIGITGVLAVAHGGTGNSAVDTAPVSGSTKMVTSGGVFSALAGKANTSHGTHVVGKTITTDFATKYRTQTKGDTGSGDYFSVIRSETLATNAPQFGTGIGWGRGDTHGYLYVNYNNAAVYVGGGNQDKLNWTKQLAFSDHNHSGVYAPVSHTHTRSQITDFPATLKNPYPLSIQLNGGTATSYDGGAGVSLNITAASVGASASNHNHDTAYLKLTGGTVTGTLVLASKTDASGTIDSGPALVIGGARSADHIEIDSNEIMAKATGTSVTTLYLNADGGLVNIGGGGLSANNLTANMAVVTDSSKKLISSTTTATELSYVHGVTSAIQTQLNSKATSSHTHNSVKDIGNSNDTTFAYSKAGLDSTAWFAAWNNYELRAISPANVLKTIGAATSSHNHDTTYLKLTGGTLTGRIQLPSAGTSWQGGMTVSNASIGITTQNNNGSYFPIIAGKTYNGHFWNMGSYIDDFGFYGYKAGRNTNGTDWSFKINVSTGAVSSTGTITAPTFYGALSGNASTATALQSNAGSGTQPIYFSGGKPVNCSYTLGASVPAGAKFTDTTYGIASTTANGLMTKEMVTKLNGIQAGAQVNLNPATTYVEFTSCYQLYHYSPFDFTRADFIPQSSGTPAYLGFSSISLQDVAYEVVRLLNNYDWLHVTLFGNTSTSNIPANIIGTTSISGIGNGTITGAISALNTGVVKKNSDNSITVGGVHINEDNFYIYKETQKLCIRIYANGYHYYEFRADGIYHNNSKIA